MIQPVQAEGTPQYLPARMLNEFVYCPRLFYYEWVEGLFAHNRETVEGALRHEKLEIREDELTPAAEAAEAGETIHSRSVTLSSDRHSVIARLDLIEGTGNVVTPVDYKRGAPRVDSASGELRAWDPDRAQLCVQALILREHGYQCDEAVVYYVATKQRVRIAIDESLVEWTLERLNAARRTAESDQIPLPLVDSPKCPRCSLVGICLPDETRCSAALHAGGGHVRQPLLFDAEERRGAELTDDADSPARVRRLVPARDDLRPLYLNTQGLKVGKSGGVLKVQERDKLLQEVRITDICQLNLFGNIQITTQAIQELCQAEIPIAYFSMGGWFYGITQGLGVKNIFLRKEQFRLADVPAFCLRVARALVAGKIRNQRVMLQRNHVEPSAEALAFLKALQFEVERVESLESLLGLEGTAARTYFQNFAGMIKQPDEEAVFGGSGEPTMKFDFQGRNRRPPRDPVNALLSLAYSVLAKDLTIITQAVGLDPFLGFYHQPRFGRAALALDLMEPFRPLIADSAVLSALNTRMVTPDDFLQTGDAVALTPNGRKAFFRAYEQRMDTLVTHPLFGYRVSYRRLLEIQTRLLVRVLCGELSTYPVFTTR